MEQSFGQEDCVHEQTWWGCFAWVSSSWSWQRLGTYWLFVGFLSLMRYLSSERHHKKRSFWTRHCYGAHRMMVWLWSAVWAGSFGCWLVRCCRTDWCLVCLLSAVVGPIFRFWPCGLWRGCGNWWVCGLLVERSLAPSFGCWWKSPHRTNRTCLLAAPVRFTAIWFKSTL